jgi:hypothetical protein
MGGIGADALRVGPRARARRRRSVSTVAGAVWTVYRMSCRLTRLLAIVTLLSFPACVRSPVGSEAGAVVSIRFVESLVEVPEGEAAPLELKFIGRDGEPVAAPKGVRVSWASSESQVADVAPDGRVVALRGGETVVTASLGPHSAEARVVVVDREEGVLVAGSAAVLAWGGFGGDPGALRVTIDGHAATVRAATPAELEIVVPGWRVVGCRPTTEVEVEVTAGARREVRRMPLRAGTRVRLAPGQSALLGPGATTECLELEADAAYAVAIANTSSVATTRTPFRLAGSGAPGTGVSASSSMVSPSLSAAAARSTAEASPTDHAHSAALEASRIAALTLRGASASSTAGPPGPASASIAAQVTRAGDLATRRIPLTSSGEFGACTAASSLATRVVYAGPRLVIHEDRASPTAGMLDARWTELGREFETVMLPLLRDSFGDPASHPVMRDRPLEIVASPAVNRYGAGGFTWTGDLFPPASCASSNHAGVMYIAVPLTEIAIAGWWRDAPGTVVHEAKHLVSYAERLSRGHPLEESWLEEATARIAEELWGRTRYGYRQGANSTVQQAGCALGGSSPGCAAAARPLAAHVAHLRSVFASPTDRTPFGNPSGTDLTFYGSAWWLVRYAIDQAAVPETEFLRALIVGPRRGADNLAARAGRAIEDLIGHAAMANLLDGRDDVEIEDRRHTHPSWSIRDLMTDSEGRFALAVEHLAAPFPDRRVTLRAGAAWYAEIDTRGVRTLSLLDAGGAAAPSTLRLGIARLR